METSSVEVNKNTYTQVNSGLGPILIEATEGEVHVALSDTRPDRSTKAFHRLQFSPDHRQKLKFGNPGTNTWILGTEDRQQLAIVTEEQDTLEITEDGGVGVAVFVQDQTTGILGVPFGQVLLTPDLGVDTVINSRTVTLAPGHGLVDPTHIGKILEIADTTNGSWFMQNEILAIVGDVVTIDCRVPRIFTVANSIVSVSNRDMNVDGLVTPQVFSILPTSLQRGDITRIIFEMWGTSAMDFEKFGDLPALSNGCVLRVNNGDGTYRNLYNFKSNGDIIQQTFDYDITTNVGNSVRSFVARLTWGGKSKHGAVIRLDGSKGTSLEYVIQDDLTLQTRNHLNGQGSELQG